MKLTLRLDPLRLRRWHIALAEILARRAGMHLSIEWNRTGEPLPAAVALLFALERLVYGLPADDTVGAAPADLGRFAAASEAPDLVLDLTAGMGTKNTARTLLLTFDGMADEARRSPRWRTRARRWCGSATRRRRRDRQRSSRHRIRRRHHARLPRCAVAHRDLIVAALDGAAARIEANVRARRLSNTARSRGSPRNRSRAPPRGSFIVFATTRHTGASAGASSTAPM